MKLIRLFSFTRGSVFCPFEMDGPANPSPYPDVGTTLVVAPRGVNRATARVAPVRTRLTNGSRVDSLPPCGGGMGWGVVPWSTEVPYLPTPPHKGEGRNPRRRRAYEGRYTG